MGWRCSDFGTKNSLIFQYVADGTRCLFVCSLANAGQLATSRRPKNRTRARLVSEFGGRKFAPSPSSRLPTISRQAAGMWATAGRMPAAMMMQRPRAAAIQTAERRWPRAKAARSTSATSPTPSAQPQAQNAPSWSATPSAAFPSSQTCGGLFLLYLSSEL